MKIQVLFAQRPCSYPGELALEALEVCDEVTMDENPDWIYEKERDANKTGEFVSTVVISVDLGESGRKTIAHRLAGIDVIPGTVI
jgi:hypothetical protein